MIKFFSVFFIRKCEIDKKYNKNDDGDIIEDCPSVAEKA